MLLCIVFIYISNYRPTCVSSTSNVDSILCAQKRILLIEHNAIGNTCIGNTLYINNYV